MTPRWVKCTEHDRTIYLNMANAVKVVAMPDGKCSVSFMRADGEHNVYVNESAETVVGKSGGFE